MGLDYNLDTKNEAIPSAPSRGFDPCLHLVSMMMLAFGRVLLPDEKDTGKIIEYVSDKIGMRPLQEVPKADPALAGHPYVSGEFVPKEPKQIQLPRKKCESCHRVDIDPVTKEEIYTANLRGICSSCKDAETDPVTKKPKYRSMWFCGEQDKFGKLIPSTGCGYMEKSDKHISQWFTELNFDFRNANKQSLGIKTVTDEGLK